MKAVEVRELKNRLSEYLRLVKAGENVLVTDRGEAIAELHQPTLRRVRPAERGLGRRVRENASELGFEVLPLESETGS